MMTIDNETFELLTDQESLGKLANVLYHCFTTSPPTNTKVPQTYVGEGVSDTIRHLSETMQSVANEMTIANMIALERYRREHPSAYEGFIDFLSKQQVSGNFPAAYDSYAEKTIARECDAY